MPDQLAIAMSASVDLLYMIGQQEIHGYILIAIDGNRIAFTKSDLEPDSAAMVLRDVADGLEAAAKREAAASDVAESLAAIDAGE